MTSEEMRREIARLKGLFWEDPDSDDWRIDLPDGSSADSDTHWTMSGERIAEIVAAMNGLLMPNWPSDIAAAWELFEEMVEAAEGGRWLSITVPSSDMVGKCYVHDNVGRRADSREYGEGETVPLAISAAYLKWKRSQEP